MSASSANRSIVLSLYKQLLREGSKFSAYNFRFVEKLKKIFSCTITELSIDSRNYAYRRTRDVFKANKTLSEDSAIKIQIEEAAKNLEAIKRQVRKMFNSSITQ